MTTPVGPANADPPLWVAWHQALAGLRVRFTRHVLTGLGICLGTAFFAAMLTLRAVEAAVPEGRGGSDRHLWLAGTSLAMCLFGVTNAMLMSVTERFREIGTIKCLGASDGFIVKVFLFEAVLLGAGGSFMGALVGTLAMAASLSLTGFEVTFPSTLQAGIWSGAAGLALSLVSAVAPAIQAARMPAAAALRVEV